MAWTAREVTVLGLLLLCVPAQYWVMTRWVREGPGSSPQLALQQLGRQLQRLHLVWLEGLEWWKRSYLQVISALRRTLSVRPPRDAEECPAKEVALYRERTGYFGLSPLPRPIRPGYLGHRVGQVVKVTDQTFKGALGVIIAWDLYARAPESWLKNKYEDDTELRREPHYRILLARPLLREIYVAQRHLKVLRSTQINHPRVPEIFSHFDGAQYIPRQPLRALYPLD